MATKTFDEMRSGPNGAIRAPYAGVARWLDSTSMTMAVDDKTGGTPLTATSQTSDAPVIVDLGRRRKKLVRRLRKGTGKLMDEVQAAIGEIQRTGRISANAQPIIVVVTQKPKSKRFGGMPMFC